LVLAREAGTGFEALADLGVVGAGQELDQGRLAALRLAVQPQDGDGRLLAKLFEALLKFGVASLGGKQAFDLLEHGFTCSGIYKYCRREGPGAREKQVNRAALPAPPRAGCRCWRAGRAAATPQAARTVTSLPQVRSRPRPPPRRARARHRRPSRGSCRSCSGT